MKNTLIYILLLTPILMWGQEERKHIRTGYKAYMNGEYNEAEVDFRKAEEVAPNSFAARYNTGTSLFQQKNLEESGKVFSDLLSEAPNEEDQAKLLHNMGNVLLENNKYQEAADAYKKSLKLNPGDEDTRYNLAYALEKLREQQENKDQENKDQENKEQENKDQENKEQENKEQENKEQENKEQEQQNQDKQSEDQKQQQQKMELSKDEAERLLNAILQKEKDVKEKVDKKKAAGAKVKTEKDW